MSGATATYTATELAELLGTSRSTLHANRDDFPVPCIRVGRRVVWPKAAVDRLLGLEQSGGPAATAGPVATTCTATAPATITTPGRPDGSG